MSDDFDKSEAASPYKLEEARKKGQVFKSSDFTNWITSTVALLLIALISDRFSLDFTNYVKRFMDLYDVILTPSSVYIMSLESIWFVFSLVVPPLLVLLLFSIAAQVCQTGFVWTSEQLKFDFSRLNPITGCKKFFNRKVLFDFTKHTLKLVAVAFVFYLAASNLLAELMYFSLFHSQYIQSEWTAIMLKFCALMLLVVFPFSIADLRFGYYEFMRKMRMSKREVKDEFKKREGDPHIKSKQRHIQQEILKRSASLSQVPRANLVVVNPTYIAVAMFFDRKTMLAPKVLSAGKGDIANQIRIIARQHQIPIVQHKKLARRLYKGSHIGGYVSEDCFGLLVPVYRWVLEWQEKDKF